MTESVVVDGTPLFWVSSTELDFITAIEAAIPLPIAFKTRKALDRWISKNWLTPTKIGKRDDIEDVILIHGRLKRPNLPDPNNIRAYGIPYRQIWASVKYNQYREAMKFAIKKSEGSYKTVDLFDGDHAVSQTRLLKVWPEAWVNMVLVERGVNRAIGAMMEKEDLRLKARATCIEINAECLLKTFLAREGALEGGKLWDYLGETRQRFLQCKEGIRKISEKTAMEQILSHMMAQHATEFFDGITQSLNLKNLEQPVTGLEF